MLELKKYSRFFFLSCVDACGEIDLNIIEVIGKMIWMGTKN